MRMKTQCLIIDDEPLARKLLQSHADRTENLVVVAQCSNAMGAMAALQQHQVDLIFLDIRMPELDGLQLLKALPHPPSVIFTTAYREFGADAFDLNAIDYLVKPIAFDRFLKAVNKYFELRALGSTEPENKEDWFFVTSNRKKVCIETDKILLVESLNDHVQIHLQDNVINTRDTISSISTRLPSSAFVRVHRAFIIPRASIQRISSEGVETANRFVPFGRAYRHQALKSLGLR